MNEESGSPVQARRCLERLASRTAKGALSVAVGFVLSCSDGSSGHLASGGRGELRRFEPRWSHDPPWHRCHVPKRPGLSLVTCAPATNLLETSAAPGTDSRARVAEALDSLQSDDVDAIRRSVTRLREERRRRRGDARLENDLAVSLALAAQVEESPVLLVHALGAIERAAALAPDDRVVRFNRALILGYLQISEAAEAAWRDYLRLDADSPWAGEALQHLRRIVVHRTRAAGASSGAVDAVSDPQRERHRLQELVLAEWSEIDDPDRARALLESELASMEWHAAATGDDLLVRTYRLLLDSGREEASELRRDLRQGHRLLARANLALDAGTYAETLPLLRQARGLLSRAGSPLWVWAEHGVLRCAYQRSDFDEVEDIGREILNGISPGSAIAGRTWWVLGSARFGRGDFAGAEEAFRAASAVFAALGEGPNKRAVDSMLAALLEWVGRREAAWKARHAVLAQLSDQHDARRLLVLVDAAMAAADLGEPEAALVIHDLAVAQAERESDPRSLANALLKRAVLFAGAPSLEGARAEQDFERSVRSTDQIVDPDQREGLRAQLLLEWGKSDLSRGDHSAAIRRLEEAAQQLAAGDSPHLWLPEADAALGRAFALAGDHAAAEGRLRKAVAELDRQRLTASGIFDRVLLADRSDAVHEELLRLLLDRGEGRRALDITRQARSQSWRTRTGTAVPPAGAIPAASSPADGVAVVTYAVLADRLAIWTEKRSGLRLAQANVPRPELDDLITTTRAAIAAASPGSLALLRDLHRILVEPIAAELVGVDRLVIEADESLFGVPFAALLDAQGMFLVERYSIALRAAAIRQPTAERSSDAPRILLAVADPAFAEDRNPHLERLPAAAYEVVALATSYAEPVLLVDRDATEREVLRLLPHAEVVHVAAHGLASSRDPLTSSLVLAPDGDAADGILTVAELLDVDLPAGPVVVLAACESIGGFFSRADGPVGLAWPFLARGASSVVATLWEIDDAAAGKLVVRLHEGLGRGEGPHFALRSAQLAAIEANVGVEVWSPWVLLR